MFTSIASQPSAVGPSQFAISSAWTAAKVTSDPDLVERIAAGESSPSSNADPAQSMTFAQALPSSLNDDAEVMRQMFAAFGGLYESAAKINQLCNEAKNGHSQCIPSRFQIQEGHSLSRISKAAHSNPEA